MAELSFIVGVIGNVISVVLFLSPLKTMIRVVKRGSTEEFDSLPYICTFLSAALWTYYGIIKPGAVLVATVNGFGALVQLIYVTLFFIFAASPIIRGRINMQFMAIDVGFFGMVILVSSFMLHGDERINMIGFAGAALNIIMYASPLSAMRTVLATRNVEYMPLLLSLCVFFNSGVWTLYAFLVEDLFLAIPNGAGVILGAVQLIVYAIYSRRQDDQPSDQYHLIE